MNQIIETVPNISESRNQNLIEDITDNLESVSEAAVLDVDSDNDHNRTVYTIAGSPEGIRNAVLQLVALAIEKIDLRHHTGEHPRMGAIDVIPFVPVNNVSMSDCVELSEEVGEQISSKYELPVYLYAQSARSSDREDLANIRRGEFEGFTEKIKKEEWAPDYGDAKVHPTAGVTAVGARTYLIAFNVNLDTDDLSIARDIARSVRNSGGGLRCIKALGFKIEDGSSVQVSMNATDYKQTPLHQALELVRETANRFGVTVTESEIVGLTPRDALLESAKYYLQLHSFEDDQILEQRLDKALKNK